MSRPVLADETREAYLAAHEPLADDAAVADERYRTLVTSAPGTAILDLYGATEAAVEAMLALHVVDTPAPDGPGVPRELPTELFESCSLQDWVRAQRASLAAVQVLVEYASASISLDLPSTVFPVGPHAGAPVVVPLCIGPTGAIRWLDIEYAAATLPSPLHPGPETEAALRAAGFEPAADLVPTVVANTSRLHLSERPRTDTSVPDDLARLASDALSTLCRGTWRDGTGLLASTGSVDVDGMSLG